MADYAVMSKSGGRPVNEDAVAVCEGANGQLFILCDGLGGHGHGEVASALATEAARAVFEREALPSGELLPLCIAEAQNALVNEQRRQGLMNEMKTTLVLLHLKDGVARWAHVGDSRLYLFRKHKMAARTLDHSVPQMLVAQGEIREAAIRHHEDRNRLTRVLGMDWESPRFDLGEELLLDGSMSFLLCSDGFWELIVEKEMGRLLKNSPSPQDWLARMEEVVLKNGQNKNMDNYSAIGVFAGR